MSTAATRELLRQRLLLAAEQASPSALAAEAYLIAARSAGFASATAEQIGQELAYLADKQLLEQRRSALSAGLLRWGLTAAGREHLEAEGLLG